MANYTFGPVAWGVEIFFFFSYSFHSRAEPRGTTQNCLAWRFLVMFRVVLRLLWSFGAVFTASAPAAFNAGSIQYSAHHMIAHPWQIFYAATADNHNRVLLQIMSLPWNICRHFHAIGQAHTRNFTQRRVWLLWRYRRYFNAHPALKRRVMRRRTVLQRIKRIRQSWRSAFAPNSLARSF